MFFALTLLSSATLGLAANGDRPAQQLARLGEPDYDTVVTECNRQGDAILRTDQNGTVHSYGFDGLGRPTTDSVTTLGDAGDDTVLQIAWTYCVDGMLEHITSYASATGGTVVNDVLRVYNGFQQLVTEYQEHGGAVNTGTSANVQYVYADGSGNTIRLTGIIYPNGRQVSLVYDSPADDMLSRPTAIVDGTLTSGLISYWPLNEEVSSGTRYDSADGNNLADVDSNVNNAAGLSSGNLGVAAQFTTSPNSQLALNPAPDLGFNNQSFTTTNWGTPPLVDESGRIPTTDSE